MRYELMLPHQIRTAIKRELAGGAAAGRARISRRASGRGMDTLVVVEGAGASREGDGSRHPAAVLLRRQQLRGRAAGGQRLGAGERATSCCPSRRSCSAGCCASAFATSTSSSTTRPRTSPRACRPTWRSSSRRGRPSSISSKRSAARAGGAIEKMATYYAKQATGDDPFNWIKVHPLMTAETIRQYPFDHAGQGETSLMMALLPGRRGHGAALGREQGWYTTSAKQASAEARRQGPRPDPGACED